MLNNYYCIIYNLICRYALYYLVPLSISYNFINSITVPNCIFNYFHLLKKRMYLFEVGITA